ncbi:CBU_0592 family membrane protein [Sphingomonas rubra]|uniref:CBU-0592-like domain-containing protein n=1 Tax=Sphingomonas rubra TaxID=634430 RepID=A0A1I5T7J1_9SPHN|nr:cyclic nucleotide-binding protein [Sphingomonas rubra]SFP79024.1 hypothetical protein SAMN04488241_107109 [Sphingomonas rubra]
MALPDVIGLLGVAAYISAYALLQLEKLGSSDTRYLVLNGLGSGLILVSLFYSFNLPSFITQALWLVFTVVGVVRARGKARAGG